MASSSLHYLITFVRLFLRDFSFGTFDRILNVETTEVEEKDSRKANGKALLTDELYRLLSHFQSKYRRDDIARW